MERLPETDAGSDLAKYPDKSAEHAAKREYFSGLEAQLRAIKDAWRNPTMHSVAKLHTDEMAHGLVGLVKTFFLEAAKELRERTAEPLPAQPTEFTPATQPMEPTEPTE